MGRRSQKGDELGWENEENQGKEKDRRGNMDAGGICPHLIASMLCRTPSKAWPSVGFALVLWATPGPHLHGFSTALMVKLPLP